MKPAKKSTPPPSLRSLHKETCGIARMERDSYLDVRLACERKLLEWEQLGIIPPPQPRSNDWLFASSSRK